MVEHFGPNEILFCRAKMWTFTYTLCVDHHVRRPMTTLFCLLGAKSRDHEVVRAQKKVSKGRPKAPSNSRSVVTDHQV